MFIIIILLVIAIIILTILLTRKVKSNEIIKNENHNLEIKNIALQETYKNTISKIDEKRIELCDLDADIKNKKNIYQNILETYEQTINESKEKENLLFNNWKQQKEKEFQEYQESIKEEKEELQIYLQKMQEAYDTQQQALLDDTNTLKLNLEKDINKCKEEIQKFESWRAALVEAARKEKEIKEHNSFYCLQIPENDLLDIKVLDRIKPELKNSRILSMLIWSTYYQKPMTTLCNNVIGLNVTCGIYKITNQLSNLCYIGQSVDIAKRLKDHAKCGLGIDTPANNKLYKAIQQDGLQNFSFEVLEKCSKDKLDEREKYYINLYKSKDYGYNSSAGNGK